MWIKNDITPINLVFNETVSYRESWGHEYQEIKLLNMVSRVVYKKERFLYRI